MRHIGADHGCDFLIHENLPCEARLRGGAGTTAEATYLLSQVPGGEARYGK
jgi:hypothetical protein